MEIYVLSPNKSAVFNSEQISKLESMATCIFHTEPKPLSEIPNLFSSDEDKVLAIDPDFCDWNLSGETIKSIKNLKAICLQTTSFSWIDMEAVSELSVPVCNLKGFSSEAVAEYAFAMALNVARKLPVVIKDNFKQDFVAHQGIELKGRTVGIVGLGDIGLALAELCLGFGMNVQYWSRDSRNDSFSYVELDELFSSSDVIFPTLAKNDETEKIITDELLQKMYSESIFVSIVHELYSHTLLLELAKGGHIFGYAFEDEDGNPRNYEGNVLPAPQIAWATKESMLKNGEMWTDCIVNAVNNEFPNRVN